jgi:hypothetical protein
MVFAHNEEERQRVIGAKHAHTASYAMGDNKRNKHGKQEPIFVDHKVFANPSAYVKYSVEFAFATNAM